MVAKQWNASARVQAFAKEHNLKDAHAIQAYFNTRVQKLLQKRGKILIGWDEVLHPTCRRISWCNPGAGRSRSPRRPPRAIAAFFPGATTSTT